jgi:hypothetical protein
MSETVARWREAREALAAALAVLEAMDRNREGLACLKGTGAARTAVSKVIESVDSLIKAMEARMEAGR